ncbi:hypothetical protein [Aulosira sp. FACHB-615]|uniref:hypothetical protein n=1 Tax=Aulosira sp. FACHB-615 TaxID=2692777 RepID=UPI001684D437|nr:hypothetical protein [Aulosira sp. FACHB-615]MBD2486660.1 hypothetical protein [Aulosira sp. FACHB-615]
MQKNIAVLGVLLLLSACSSSIDGISQATNTVKAKVENCPQAEVVALPGQKPNEGFYDRFDWHIRNIIANDDTIRFQTLKQDFVFCRANNTWTVQKGTLPKDLQPPSNYTAFAQEIVNPKFKNINLQGKTYQYRVIQEPNYSLNSDNNLSRPEVKDPTKDKIVFELITPNNKTPQRQTLYTLKDLQNAAVKAGFSAEGNLLGVPRITSNLIYGDQIWWSIAFEQGEGNNGIATIVSYDPKTDKFSLIQPEALAFTQITDLAITGDVNSPTFWMGTNVSGEGNLYIPAKGLVAYRPDGSLSTYTTHNSPLVGAIPDKIRVENNSLWVSSANGVCQVKWQAADNPESWSCWRFTAMAKVPETLPIYSASTNQKSAASLSANQTVEVLWWSPVNFQTNKGRYEVTYPQGFTAKLNEGASKYEFGRSLPAGKTPIEWPGFEWHWNGQRFIRALDEVSLNLVGGGPQGIGSGQLNPNPELARNWNAMRGDLELLDISPKSTSVKYYSGWVDSAKLQPYLTVVPQTRPQNPQPNPLLKVK